MALTTYAELQASVLSWLDYTDSSRVANSITDFIALAESDMSAVIRARNNTALATVTVPSTGLADVPTGFRKLRTVRLTESPRTKIEVVSLDKMAELLAGGQQAGNPQAVAVEGDTLRFWPAPSANTDAVVKYYRTIPALSDSNTTNWVLANYPNAYLYGALCHGWAYADDDRNEAKCQARFAASVAQINREGADMYGDEATPIPEATTP